MQALPSDVNMAEEYDDYVPRSVYEDSSTGSLSCFPVSDILFRLSGDVHPNPGPYHFTVCSLNIRPILHPLHSAALSDIIDTHHPLLN